MKYKIFNELKSKFSQLLHYSTCLPESLSQNKKKLGELKSVRKMRVDMA